MKHFLLIVLTICNLLLALGLAAILYSRGWIHGCLYGSVLFLAMAEIAVLVAMEKL